MKVLFASVDRLADAMSFHRDRHTVLAGNVANIDTPGYRPMDLTRSSAGATVASVGTGELVAAGPEGVGLARTSAGHLQAPAEQARSVSFSDEGEAASADGNSVMLERELAKIDANRVRYGASAELVSRRLALLRYAASDGS